MWNELQDVLSYLFRDGYEFNIVLCDTEVQATHKIKKKTDLKKITFKGGGGTILSGGIAYCESNWPKDFVLVLTDGYTDRLEFARPGNVVLSTGAAPDTNGNCKVFVRPRRS
jgi:predicted metal-dependent peptidase